MASSDFETFCEAAALDLTTEVPGLRDASVHLFTPWDPEQQVPDGDKHLAIWPQAEEAETAEPLVTGPGGDLLVQLYAVLYWEPAGDESSRGIADMDAARDLFALHNDVRARFYAIENITLGGTVDTRYIGSRFPERSGQVRWFALALRARRAIDVA